ncbi:MAG: DnaA regulatory inactivator Hda [SAR86 cluster bacterium]|uniref:DnaA regulatory inactivator Hda n=1 Tax=SAR86 cluster bacterium TaxID=2030880 RepID=A0A2A5B9J1_9GAMM|nr:MAG: DnaA regulatory inactivator Hda [SAR86 cluster bacterium]
MLPAHTGQLTLGIGLDDDARFENYFVSSHNQQAITHLQDASERFIYVWGNGSPGLTHILQAACHQLASRNESALYLPLKDKSQFSSQILTGISSLALVCLDDIDEISGDENWESALFTAFNEIKDSNARLIIVGKSAPQNLQIQLPDLKSRLQSGLILQIQKLSDEDKLLALQLRAKKRGIELTDSVAEFILIRAERSLSALIHILDELDESSLIQKRKLTIPLVKSTLGW